jgi:hypothetical protein
MPVEDEHQPMQFAEEKNTAGQVQLGRARKRLFGNSDTQSGTKGKGLSTSKGCIPVVNSEVGGPSHTVTNSIKTAGAQPSRVVVLQGASSAPVSIAVYEG